MSLRRVLVGLGAMLAIAAPTSAFAKVQEFTVEWSTPAPVAGAAVKVTIRFWDDPEHADRAHWPSHSRFEAFLWAFPAGSSPAGPHDAIPIDVVSVRRGVMVGEVVFASAGTWTICSSWVRCADPEVSGYPGRMELVVSTPTPPETATPAREAGSTPAEGGSAPPVAMAAVVVAAVAGAALGVRRLRRR